MTFPIDFWMHPKVAPMSDAAFRAFVEMNGYSRQQRLDGRIPTAVANRMWPVDALTELCGTHPERPLVVLAEEGTVLVIRDYAEHQETVADEEARRSRNRANGAKGGRPPKNRPETQSVTDSVSGSVAGGKRPGTPDQTQRKAESESESEDFYSPSKSQSSSNRARVSTDAMDVPEMTRRLAAQKGITSLRTVADSIQRHTGLRVDANGALQVAVSLLDRAKEWPEAPARYVTSAIGQSPAEVQQFIHENALEVA